MNLPSGKVIKTGMDSATINFTSLLDELKRKQFNGYLAFAIKGAGGVEEATILFDSGKFVGCEYEYLLYNKKFAGQEAFQRIINAVSAACGVIDVVQLTQEQVHLSLAVNEDLVFVPQDRDLKALKPGKFSPFFEEQFKGKAKEEKQDLLKKFKLDSLKKIEGKTDEVLKKLGENAR